jgi:hypothetical protein
MSAQVTLVGAAAVPCGRIQSPHEDEPLFAARVAERR